MNSMDSVGRRGKLAEEQVLLSEIPARNGVMITPTRTSNGRKGELIKYMIKCSGFIVNIFSQAKISYKSYFTIPKNFSFTNNSLFGVEKKEHWFKWRWNQYFE